MAIPVVAHCPRHRNPVMTAPAPMLQRLVDLLTRRGDLPGLTVVEIGPTPLAELASLRQIQGVQPVPRAFGDPVVSHCT